MRLAPILLVSLMTCAAAHPAPAADPAGEARSLSALARELARRAEARRSPRFHEYRSSTASSWSALQNAPHIELQGVDATGRPIIYITRSLDAARMIRADQVWPGGPYGYFALDGSSTASGELGVWDAGAVRTTHQELSGRVSWVDAASYAVHPHACLVGGIMASSGVYGPAKGMSPATTLDSYDWTNDLSEMTTAAANGMHVSNHSYGVGAGWFQDGAGDYRWIGDMAISTTEDYHFGYYDSLAMSVDQLAVAAPHYTIVVAAGTERDDAPPAPGWQHYHWDPADTAAVAGWVWATDVHDDDGAPVGNDSMDILAGAKNVIAVGAVHDIGDPDPYFNAIVASFSSFGPTDDGCIKPDFVASGVGVVSCGDFADNVYASGGGTSMAAPSVAGAVNLLVEYYRRSHAGAVPRSSTIKALLTQTATDVGPYGGPDYWVGWGLVNTLWSVLLIQADSTSLGEQIVEAALNDGETHEYMMRRTTYEDPIRVTLAWTDPAGAPPAPAVDPPDTMLVNDLDVRVETLDYFLPQTFLPWVLDPSNPTASVTTGDNVLDPVEQVQFAPVPAFWYRVVVSHKGTLASPQTYSLVTTERLYRPEAFSTSSAAPAATSGSAVAWADLDLDGDDDLFVAKTASGDKLLRNDGGVLNAIASPPGPTATECAKWADYDRDADPDLYLARPDNNASNHLYRNDGAGVFTLETNAPPVEPWWSNTAFASAWADYDLDGDVDLFNMHAGDPNRLFRNDGSSGFVDVTSGDLAVFYTTNVDAEWVDYDVDGDPDIFLLRGPTKLFRNDAGVFRLQSASPFGIGQPRGQAWADYDGDSDPDLYLVYTQGANKLFRNDGNGAFTDVTTGPLGDAGDGASAVWGDFDNDGRLDLFLAQEPNHENKLLMNEGGGRFEDRTPYFMADRSSSSWQTAVADWDEDGDLDIYLVRGNNTNRLLRNDVANGNAWLEVNVRTTSGPPAIGTTIRIVAAGLSQTRTVSTGGRSQDSAWQHFGLGSAALVDSLYVDWPGATPTDVWVGLAVNERIEVTPGGATGAPQVPESRRKHAAIATAVPNPFREATTVIFELPDASPAALDVYDAAGRKVRALLAETERGPGRHAVTWDGRNTDGDAAAAGVYFLRLRASGSDAARRIVKLR